VASEQRIAKPTSIKLTGGKSGGCAWKAVKLTVQGHSAAGVVVAQAMKAQAAGSGK